MSNNQLNIQVITRQGLQNEIDDEQAHILDRVEAAIELYHLGGGSPTLTQTLEVVRALCVEER